MYAFYLGHEGASIRLMPALLVNLSGRRAPPCAWLTFIVPVLQCSVCILGNNFKELVKLDDV